ncbi:Ion transport protein [Saprospira grandis DSM 2844]|uniref:Ion transport protein n=1 Tax=Saprospira grandis DSM 2844 TaxID=694433 RepID=J0PA86_9BACT|nr:ion transporter [Saprospira grandis]EJF54517.1 Ion transport protein [Saprospira grandis DSM 2844]
MSVSTNKKSLRRHIFDVIDLDQEESSLPARIFETSITILIILSILAIIAESFINYRYEGNIVDWVKRSDQNIVISHYFSLFENTTLIIFTAEFFLRLFTADFKYPEEQSFRTAAWRFFKSSGGLIDFLAISPFLFQLAHVDFRFLRALKISRLLRVLKLSSLTRSIVIVGDVFIDKRNELGITLFVTFVMLLVSSTLMWYVEGNVQPRAFPNIIATFWWAIATLTTVGYGDVFPITSAGKLLSGIIAILGIGIVALPAGILSSAFIERLERDPNMSLEQANDGEEPRQTAPEPTPAPAVAQTTNDCSDQFGQKFKFCPYCGQALDQNGQHLHK